MGAAMFKVYDAGVTAMVDAVVNGKGNVLDGLVEVCEYFEWFHRDLGDEFAQTDAIKLALMITDKYRKGTNGRMAVNDLLKKLAEHTKNEYLTLALVEVAERIEDAHE